MTPRIWFRPIMVITFVLFCILFTILIVNTELERYRIIISVTLLYWSYLFMKKIYYHYQKTKFHTKDVRSKNTQLNHMRRSSIWKLSHFELHRKALRISYLSFTSWWLNQQNNNNLNVGLTPPPPHPPLLTRYVLNERTYTEHSTRLNYSKILLLFQNTSHIFTLSANDTYSFQNLSILVTRHILLGNLFVFHCCTLIPEVSTP